MPTWEDEQLTPQAKTIKAKLLTLTKNANKKRRQNVFLKAPLAESTSDSDTSSSDDSDSSSNVVMKHPT